MVANAYLSALQSTKTWITIELPSDLSSRCDFIMISKRFLTIIWVAPAYRASVLIVICSLAMMSLPRRFIMANEQFAATMVTMVCCSFWCR